MTTPTEALRMAVSYIKGDKAWVHLQDEVLAACEEALQSQEQEPVAWMYVNDDGECEQIEYGEVFNDPNVTSLYTHPKEWQELSDDEIDKIFKNHRDGSLGRFGFARAILAKAKEKNT